MRNRIMMAAIEEINENGIKFTMADLAKRLAVSKSTLYAHFESKEKMLGAIIDVLLISLRQQDEEIMNNKTLNLHEKLKALLIGETKVLGPIRNRFVLDLKRYLPEEWIKSEKCRDYKWQCIEELLNQGIATGDFRPIDLNITKLMFDTTVNELLSRNFLLQNNLTFVDCLRKMADILCFGLVTLDKK